ncbi:MAG: hypothetical protein V1845_01580 [bacterium]
MRKLTKIKYLFWHPRLSNMPKYMAFAGMLFSAISPMYLVAQAQSPQSGKPALLAMTGTSPMFSSLDPTNDRTNEFFIVRGSSIMGQVNPTAIDGIILRNASQKNSKIGSSQNVKQYTVSQSQNIIDVKQNVIVTAYSSTVDQCDATPFITAKGTQVRDGIVAANWLPFGTRVRLPEVYGDKVFVVEDRMAKKNSHKLDVWMETREQALQFGAKRLTIEVLE